MSVLAEETMVGPRGARKRRLVLVKGSPEMVGTLLREESRPSWYMPAYQALADQGVRVIALAYKEVREGEDLPGRWEDRAFAEANLTFAGLAAFHAPIRADSKDVIDHLRRARIAVSVVSGDALLTTVHVARATGVLGGAGRNVTGTDLRDLSRAPKRGKFKSKRPARGGHDVAVLGEWGSGGEKALAWLSKDRRVRLAPFVAAQVPALSERFDLCVEGPALRRALERGGGELVKHLHHLRVFARYDVFLAMADHLHH
jgi:manganese-transporting P-type ATPase